jgi:hypothetical protein
VSNILVANSEHKLIVRLGRGTKILKRILKKEGMKEWNGFISLRIKWTGGKLL